MKSLQAYSVGIVVLTAASAAIIAFSDPIFRVLGFEYSSLSALILSIWMMLAASKRSIMQEKNIIQLLIAFIPEARIYSSIPLAASLLSLIFIPNGDLVYGLIYYMEIVVPSVVVGAILGTLIGRTSPTNTWRIALVVVSWLLWLVVSFAPGYFGPQIFTYSWQYGYFPGFVWDEAMMLRSGYWWSRVIEFAAAGSCIYILTPKRTAGRAITMMLAPIAVAAVGTIGLTMLHPSSGVMVTGGYVRSVLSDTMLVGSVTVHYHRGAFSADEIMLLRSDVNRDLDSVATFYHLSITEPADIYIYSSLGELDRFVGTHSASISKPWRHELHIAKEELQSLLHELTHVELASHGRAPFDVSWSTGFTEGAAEAVEADFDGLHDNDELAREIVQIGLAHGVSDVMSFTGFASNASAKSYVLAGSFSSYLIRTFGIAKYLTVYSSLDHENVYHVPFDSLEAGWLRSLNEDRRALSGVDSLRLRYYFGRRSIIATPCLRRIGRMMHAANQLLEQRQYEQADEVYKDVLTESSRVDAVRGRVTCHTSRRDVAGALAVLDSSLAKMDTIDRAGLHTLRGDLIAAANNNIEAARKEWAQAMTMRLSGQSFLQAGLRIYLFHDASITSAFMRSLYHKDTERVSIAMIDTMHVQDPMAILAKGCLLYQLYRSMGDVRSGFVELEHAVVQAGLRPRDLSSHDPFASDEVLFKALIAERYRELEPVFGSAMRTFP